MRDDPSPLRSMVSAGLVTATTARIWLKAPDASPLRIQVRDALEQHTQHETTVDLHLAKDSDFTGAFTIPGDVGGTEPLRPNTDYIVAVDNARDGSQLGRCRFRTSPLGNDDSPELLTVAVASCNQPFNDDGESSADARALATLAPDALRELDVSRLFFVGDQVYTDLPERFSLFDPEHFATVAPPGVGSILDCSRQQVREILHERYRHFWKFPELAELFCGWSTDLRPDDHEIVDNFGSAPEHASDRYRNLAAGALDAYYDYQAKRSLPMHGGKRPSSFHHGFEHGTIGVFAADLRSNKRADEERIQILGEEQLVSLRGFLEQSSKRHVLFILLSVPILHVPDWVATLAAKVGGESSDAADRWSYEKAAAERGRLMELLCAHQEAHPHQRIVLLGGDVHIGLASELFWSGGPRPVYQLVSSALTNEFSPWLQRAAELTPAIERDVCAFRGEMVRGRLLGGIAERVRNPVGTLNFGTVSVRRMSDEESSVRLRLYCLEREGGMPHVTCCFDSGEL